MFDLRRGLKVAGAFLVAFVLFVFLNNTSRGSMPRTGSPSVLSHRGVSQQFRIDGLSRGGCEAARMVVPSHDYLENTIPSIGAAFDRGADVVEFDIQLSRDGHWVVFHDRRLECRTDGSGPVSEQTLAVLQGLDVGYGYTADGGRTYPFRGTGIGAMPSMSEVFEAFSGRSFVLDIKTNNSGDGFRLGQDLARLPDATRRLLTLFGREPVLAAVREELPDVTAFSLASIQACLLRYIAYGWSGYVPSPCRNTPIYVPINVTSVLWGWPTRFMNRMEALGSPIVVVGTYGRGIAPGVDSLEELSRIPPDYDGGIWTNNVSRVRNMIETGMLQ